MRRRRHGEEETPWASFSDALSGMLFVFVITTFWFALRLRDATEAQEAALKTLTEASEAAKALVADEAGSKGLLTKCLDDSNELDAEPERESARVSTYMQVPDADGKVKWFETCQARLGPTQKTAADTIRRCLAEVIGSVGDRYTIRVFVEGHTDAAAVGKCDAGLVSNWELSGARAAAVTRAVLAGGTTHAAADTVSAAVDTGSLQLLAVGLADTRPAWSAICKGDRSALTPYDHEVCEALKKGSVSELHTKLTGEDRPPCMRSLGMGSCEGGSDAAAMCAWANWCAEPPDTGDARRSLLRRVDLRIELVPRLAQTSDDERAP